MSPVPQPKPRDRYEMAVHAQVCDCHSTAPWVLWDGHKQRVIDHIFDPRRGREVLLLAKKADRMGYTIEPS